MNAISNDDMHCFLTKIIACRETTTTRQLCHLLLITFLNLHSNGTSKSNLLKFEPTFECVKYFSYHLPIKEKTQLAIN